MGKFDPVRSLEVIQEHQVTHSQWVPTMFIRMLKLPPDQRESYDVSSLRYAVHAAAPCPVEVKQKMIDWWGPIVCEYYTSTEMVGITQIGPQEWLEHPGSVGRAILGIPHVCDDGQPGHPEVETGTDGLIYFERDAMPFEYLHDPAKTAEAQHPLHKNWATVGDVGHVDGQGFVYLTDRRAFTIISGGVNIYPQEIENVLALHPRVADVAVIGLPHEDMGQEVKAVIQPAPGIEGTPDLETELIEYVKGRIARYKAPRSIDFVTELPRNPVGKLEKKKLLATYDPSMSPARGSAYRSNDK
jgi:fatty-acyl-CoA synthase